MTQTIRERAVEGIAKAIGEARGCRTSNGVCITSCQCKITAGIAYRAAIGALEEPTHEMLTEGIVHDNLTSAGLRDAWRAMVQEAGR